MKPILSKLSKQFLARKKANFKRFLYDQIDFGAKIIGIRGGRGSGKTTLMHQYAKSGKLKPTQILYISCDHPAMVDENLYNIAEEFNRLGGRLLLIDEVHKAESFAAHIKAMYDFLDLQVIFSGSSAMQIDTATADLSRRATIHTLPVLSFREFLALKENLHFKSYPLQQIIDDHESIALSIMEEIKPVALFREYLKFGAYPFFKESVTDYSKRLTEVVNTTIDVDLASINSIKPDKSDKLKKVLYMLCCSSPYEISKSKLSGDAGISWPTLSNYLDYMDAGSLIHIVRGGKGHKTVNRPDKIVLNNPNLFEAICAEPNIGALRESFFVSQLSPYHQVHYHHEGDFLIDETYTFEVGGPSKDAKQIKHTPKGYLAVDDIESGDRNRIPLWLFGFLY